MIKFIAHMGEAAEAPENTMESFLLAWTNGSAQGIEGDFHLSKDDILVCMHDETATRTGGDPRKIVEMTAEEFQSLDVGAWKGPQWRGCRPPTLTEVLQSLPENGEIFVEIKRSGSKLSQALEAARLAAGVREDQITVISFVEDALRSIRKHLPRLKTLFLIATEKDQATGAVKPSAEELTVKLRSLDVDGVDCCAHDHINEDYVKTIMRNGFEFHVWTIDDLKNALRFAGYGVNSITTNCPTALRRQWPKS